MQPSFTPPLPETDAFRRAIAAVRARIEAAEQAREAVRARVEAYYAAERAAQERREAAHAEALAASIAACPRCAAGDRLPPHEGRSSCRQGSWAVGGTQSHCTCSGCW